MKKYWTTYLFVFMAFTTLAQQPLDLEDAILEMKNNNTRLRVQEREIELSEAEKRATLSGFLPSVSVGYTGFRTDDPLNVFGFKLQQKSVSQEDFNPMLLNNPKAFSNYNTKFSVQQPLLNFDVFAARQAVSKKIKAMEHQKDFAESMLTVEIKKAYANLQFLYEAEIAVQKGMSAYEEVLRNTENMKEQGYAKTSDVLMVQVGLNEVKNREIDIRNNIENLSDFLSWLMGKPLGTIYKPTETLSQNPLIRNTETFSENRPDILAMKEGIEAQNKMAAMNRNALFPRVNAFGEFNYNDKEIFDFENKSYLVGLALSWDIFDGNTSLNKMKQAKINAQKSEEEMVLYIEEETLKLRQAKRDLALQADKISLAETAKNQAEESFRILKNRYNQGLEKTSDLLISQATDLEKQVNYLEAIKDYNMKQIEIEFLTQTTN